MRSLQKVVQCTFILTFLTVIVLALTQMAGKSLDCKYSTLGGDWILLIILGVIQSVVIVFCAIYINKELKQRMDYDRETKVKRA